MFSLNRFLGPISTLIALIAGGWYLLTHAPPPLDSVPSLESVSSAPRPSLQVTKPSDRIRIATFNIERLGVKKTSDPNVMSILSHILRHFDVIAIQEIVSAETPVIDLLVQSINQSGARYSGIVSKRLGESTYQEQYAFVWDAQRVELIPGTTYEVLDPGKRMAREPYASSFQTRLGPQSPYAPFRFTLVNVHTVPEKAAWELNVLDDVYRSIRAYEYPEEDVILLGDLNAGPGELGELAMIPGMVSAVRPGPTNTAGTHQYDHIMLDRYATTEALAGQSGVLDYERDLGLTSAQAQAVSDHRPVWAEFQLFESTPATSAMAAPSPPLRQ